MADRELIYRIRVIADDANASALQDFVNNRLAAERRITEGLAKEIAKRRELRNAELVNQQAVSDREFAARMRLLDRMERLDRQRAVAATSVRAVGTAGGASAAGSAVAAVAIGSTRGAGAASGANDDIRERFRRAAESIDNLRDSTEKLNNTRKRSEFFAPGNGASGLGALAAGSPLYAALAAAAASIAAGVVIKETLTGEIHNANSFGGRIAAAENTAAEWLSRTLLTKRYIERNAESGDSVAQKIVSQDAMERTLLRYQTEAAGRARAAGLDEINRSSAEGRFNIDLDRRMREGRFGASTRSLADQLSQATGMQSTLRGMRGRSGVDADRLTAAEVETAERRLTIEQKILAERRKGIREGIEGAERELQTVRQRLATEREKYDRAAEGFGRMDPFEQMRAIAAKRKADSLGAGALTREERSALRSVGTSDATDIASRGDREAAERAGFSRFFGRPDRERIAADEATTKKLEVELKGKRELIARLDTDEKAVVARLTRELSAILDERDRALLKAIADRTESLRLDLARQTNEQLLNRAGLSSGR